MLSYWGSVIIEANTTGFAMEFIGDMNDSTAMPRPDDCWEKKSATQILRNCGTGAGAIGGFQYDSMSTGPNLQ